MNKRLLSVFLALFVFTRCTAVSILAGQRTQAGGWIKRNLRGNNEAMDSSEDERTPTNFLAFKTKAKGLILKGLNVPRKTLRSRPRGFTRQDKRPSIDADRLPESSGTLQNAIRAQNRATNVSKKKRTSTLQVRASQKRVPHSSDTNAPPEALNPMGSRVTSLQDTVPKKATAASTPTMSGQIMMNTLQPAADLFRSRRFEPSSVFTKTMRLSHEPSLHYDHTKYPFMALGSVLLGGKAPALGESKATNDRSMFLVLLYFDSMDAVPLKALIKKKSLDSAIVKQKMQWLVQEMENPEKHLDMLAHMAAGDQLFVTLRNLRVPSKVMPHINV